MAGKRSELGRYTPPSSPRGLLTNSRPSTFRGDGIVVAGLGRCGTSLVMTMLKQAGLRVTGVPPFYEETNPIIACRRLFSAKDVDAAKLLALPEYNLANKQFNWVWLYRDARSQISSMRKLMERYERAYFPEVASEVREFYPEDVAIENIDKANDAARWHLPAGYGFRLSFERLVSDPEFGAWMLCRHFRIPEERVPAMAAVVRPRPTGCLPDLLEAPYL